ncbi:pyridoxamine 5'-phosphate oxidase [Pedobacter sp. HMF7647]|uniref:Pyridoxamine 5'-phosphate oxidase n=1 Tax=Hufsiella arboris TaxID=2695275 RepID=A0A7K1Y6V8_9SPHI|nr:pyridoxamine 5'-phosphate oxidase family protein [Hufsiella arboris]MXV50297.1 pyridoxamine 5'-phosphate oxidase [Hufsiella arboris]
MLWASVLAGRPGFLELDEQQHIYLNPELLLSNPEDIFWQNIRTSPGIGLLFIELLTRRRFRINGKINFDGARWRIEIDQAYPNCPKYIQRRKLIDETGITSVSTHDMRTWINKADTIFVASADNQNNLDVSHRGGETGFVQYIDGQTLRIPDYAGNSMFNTLGNFHINTAAGILLMDFTNGETLQLSGQAILHINDEAADEFTGGTNRFWDFKIQQSLFSRSLFDFSFRFIDFSPFNP